MTQFSRVWFRKLHFDSHKVSCFGFQKQRQITCQWISDPLSKSPCRIYTPFMICNVWVACCPASSIWKSLPPSLPPHTHNQSFNNTLVDKPNFDLLVMKTETNVRPYCCDISKWKLPVFLRAANKRMTMGQLLMLSAEWDFKVSVHKG